MSFARSFALLAAWLWLASLSTGAAFGGRIQLDSQVDCHHPSPESPIHCTIEIRHSGDEAAQLGTVTVATLDLERPIGSWSTLPPGGVWQGDFEPLLPTQPGRHPVVVSIEYEDEAGYPFGVVAHGYYGTSLDSTKLRARLPDVELKTGPMAGSDTKLELELSYAGEAPIEADLRWLLPRDLRNRSGVELVRLEPGQELTETLLIENFSGFAGSRYRVYALLSWTEGGHSHSQFVPGEVFLSGFVPPTERFRSTATLLIGMLIGSVLLPFARTLRSPKPTAQGR